MDYHVYPEMKVSGLGNVKLIPKHWSTKRLKFMASIENGRDYKAVEVQPNDHGFPVYGSGGAFRKASDYLYEGESVLFGRKGTIDKPLYVKGKFWTVDTMFYSIVSNDVSPKYIYYLSLTIPFDLIATQTALPSVTQSDLSNCLLCCPPKDEQIQIAKFLDYKISQIDTLVETKKEVKNKLKRQRLAIITKAVTKGIDPEAVMSQTGIQWLGKIPRNWNIKRLRFVADINPVKSEVRHLDPETPVSFVAMDSIGEYGGIRLDTTKPLSDVYNGYTYFSDDDVVVAKITPCFENGKGALASGMANGIGFGTTELHVLRAGLDCSSRWLFYLTNSYAFRQIGESEMYGAGGQKRIPENFIKDFRVGIPPFEEQEAIADFIDGELQHIDQMLEVNMRAISSLDRYRRALIAAAVTGQIDVRTINIPEV